MKIILLTFISFLILTFQHSLAEGDAKNNLILFNKLMDNIEENFKNNNLEKACSNSILIKDLINKNSTSLKSIQPNYSWDEIKDLMDIIPLQLCKK